MSPTYDALKLPEHVKTVLLTGAGGAYPAISSY